MRDLTPEERPLVHQALQAYADADRRVKWLERQIVISAARHVFAGVWAMPGLAQLYGSTAISGVVAE